MAERCQFYLGIAWGQEAWHRSESVEPLKTRDQKLQVRKRSNSGRPRYLQHSRGAGPQSPLPFQVATSRTFSLHQQHPLQAVRAVRMMHREEYELSCPSLALSKRPIFANVFLTSRSIGRVSIILFSTPIDMPSTSILLLRSARPPIT